MDFHCEETEAAASQFCYKFLDTDYLSISDLVLALAEHWQEGKTELLNGSLERGLTSYDASLEKICLQAKKKCKDCPEDADWIFLSLIYQLDHSVDIFFNKGLQYCNIEVFGLEMMKTLRKQDFSSCRFWNGLLRQNILTKHKNQLFREQKSPKIKVLLDRISDPHSNDERTQILNSYILGYFLTNEITFVVRDTNAKPTAPLIMYSKNKVAPQTNTESCALVEIELKSISQLTQYMKKLLDISYEVFSEFCHTLIDHNDVLDVQLEAFLIACGKQNELLAWKNNLLS